MTWIDGFPDLAGLAAGDREALVRGSQAVRLPAGKTVFRPGAPCGAFLLVVDGSVRVQMIADTGRELVLYRVGPGQSCVLTTACLLGGEAYAAEGVVEAPTEAVAIPLGAFQGLMATSEPFRRFVFAGFGHRLAAILSTVQDAVFHRVDARLARFLLERRRDGRVAATHQDLAAELGTAREVVSRHLKAFERHGLVALERGAVRIVGERGLSAIAGRDD